ncbi:MAG: AtpZ/AtpI family protein [Planctomycetes bacterium]|nr:AtpZ/AtpI family protein [Planctomycetota bacterium]
MARRWKDQPTDASFYRAAFRWMGVGFEFCLVIGFFAFGGYWLGKLDTQDTSTAGMILGFFVGFAIMMYIIVKRAKLTEQELDEDEGQDDEDSQ